MSSLIIMISYVMPISCLCHAYGIPMSCHAYVMTMSSLCHAYVMPMSCLCHAYVMPMSSLCGRGMTRRLRPERVELWAFCRRRLQQRRRRDAWRASTVYVVGRKACAGCWLSYQGAGTRGIARARSLCCPARSQRCAVSRHAGQHRASQGTRALRSQAPRALRCARTVQRRAKKER